MANAFNAASSTAGRGRAAQALPYRARRRSLRGFAGAPAQESIHRGVEKSRSVTCSSPASASDPLLRAETTWEAASADVGDGKAGHDCGARRRSGSPCRASELGKAAERRSDMKRRCSRFEKFRRVAFGAGRRGGKEPQLRKCTAMTERSLRQGNWKMNGVWGNLQSGPPFR